MLEHKVKALQSKHGSFFFMQVLVEEQMRGDKAKGSENELKARLFELKKDYEYEKEKLFCIVSDMTRQYK